jgi:WhiB family redox-sensing transcriptional regulator
VTSSPAWCADQVTDVPYYDVVTWSASAACRDVDPELFFPDDDTPPDAPQVAEARAVCAWCPVLAQCREWAIVHKVADGIWGGLDAAARQVEWRRRDKTRRERGDTMRGPAIEAGAVVRDLSEVPERMATVVRLTWAGRTGSEVAEVTGLTKRTVVRWRARARALGLLPNYEGV